MMEDENKLEFETTSSQPPQKKKTAVWVVYLFLAFFPPVAFYLLWRDKAYHSWFATLCWLFGASLVLFSFSFNFYVLPKINTVISEFSPKKIETGASGLIWLTIILGIMQFVFGFFLKRKFNDNGELSTAYLFVCLTFLILDYVLPLLVYLTVITPLYNSIL